MFSIQNIQYAHPNGDVLFHNITFTIQSNEKVAIIGKNGIGKSTFLKIIGQKLQEASKVNSNVRFFLVPQNVGSFDQMSVAQALQIDNKLTAFYEILKGNVSDGYLEDLNDDWDIENRCFTALEYWNLPKEILNKPFSSLSGGEKTKCFLAGIIMHDADLILLDEPTNHLDAEHRFLLYKYIKETAKTFIMVSHDRTLLNLVHKTYELTSQDLIAYGGNYDFYVQQKSIQQVAIENEFKSKQKELKKAQQTAKETLQRQQKLDSKGKKNKEKQGVAKIMLNTLRNNAEKSTSKMKEVHEEKLQQLRLESQEIRKKIDVKDEMQFQFDDSFLHDGKLLVKATDLTISFQEVNLWKLPLNFEILSGNHVQIKGSNGSGKTTLLQLILQKMSPTNGTISIFTDNIVYIDQNYSLINPHITVYEQVTLFNKNNLPEHDIKTRLNRFLFNNTTWDKKCSCLSGGEQMRLILCCLNISNKAPDIIILDEPTNNLDLDNMKVLVSSLSSYKGTIILISHDDVFSSEIGIHQTITLN
ncbi:MULTISPECIES: ABC-F family ATP-binding cassette domain-containing protein [unclassified Flavobacterium]|uniref:ABC-F family ATP-binding cassette domain-containing protein n=1 Tax=unclassified Flavobacterium TaxID=196869 RepID=UPI0013D3B0DC|nr:MULTISPECIES: ABC-F family ATP-binding cassette domain-containing protein [unclassified Flavobacterium]MBA5792390.1 ABC-F family ATP-binding cassette domain-containing protein [Flavobacterium sp. xlx-221]